MPTDSLGAKILKDVVVEGAQYLYLCLQCGRPRNEGAMATEVACLNLLFTLCTDISAASLPVEVQREVSCSPSITVVKLGT